MFTIRVAGLADIKQLSELFENTISNINSKDYPDEEIIDWVSCGKDPLRWKELITALYFIVAETTDNQIVGFSSVSDDGYLHSMFVHKDFQNRGVATALYKEIEKFAFGKNIRTLTSEVSITARPFFERRGFMVDEEQKRKANKLFLTNHKMNKQLPKPLNKLINEELWQLFPIILSGHKDHWKNDYNSGRALLEEIIGKENITRISHIGSTAIPGLLSKPTIDILVEIREDTDIKDLIEKMESFDHIYSPQPDKPAPHLMFMKGYTPYGFEDHVFHIHVRYSGDWDELYFRDYLLEHPGVAEEYGILKLKLKDKFEHDRDAYTDAKTEFISEVTRLARKEFGDR